MRPGDLAVSLQPSYGYTTHRGYTNYPEEYGFHHTIYIVPDTIGIILEKRNKYCRVLFVDCEVWMEEDKMAVMNRI